MKGISMNEDFGDVTQCGEHFGRQLHRSLKVKRCENGYIVEYTAESKDKDDARVDGGWRDVTVQKVRVLITNMDLFEFVENYFKGEPNP